MVENLTIKNKKLIVFDYGGVIIDLFPEKTRNAFLRLGIKNPDELYSPNGQIKLFDEFDKGMIQPSDFLKELKKYFHSSVKLEEITEAWNAMLGLINTEKLEFIALLRKKCKVCILSNTNEIHLSYVKQKFQDIHFPGIEHFFDEVYYSCRLGMRKPEKEIFELVMKKYNVHPKEILFIDDTQMHIDGAKMLGWSTLKVNRNENWINKLQDCLECE